MSGELAELRVLAFEEEALIIEGLGITGGEKRVGEMDLKLQG
jgi:hypothetical protein